MNRKIIPIILALVAIIWQGCSSSRKTSSPEPSYQAGVLSPQQRFEALASDLGDWTELQVPLKVELSKPQKLSASGKAYMHRGVDIYVTLRFLGFEVASMYADSDSIFIIDKINRHYLAEDISALLGGVELTVSDIQDILLGRPFINGKGTLASSDFKAVKLSSTDSTLVITPQNTIKGARYSFALSNADNSPEIFSVVTPSKEFNLHYASPAATDAGLMMSSDTFSSVLGKTELRLQLQWNFNNVSWQAGNAIQKPRISSSYRRINATDLIKSFHQ